MNRIAFFNRLRTQNLYTTILQHQVDGLNAFIDEWESNPLYLDKRWLAYILATAYHETDKTMQPIEEYGKGVAHAYGKKLKYGGGPNKRVPYETPNHIYYGRGHTQNTWYEIYQKLTRANKVGLDFLNNPELLLKMRPSIWATFYGMTTGLYTGRKLAHYFDGKKEDWVNARKIINGLDKADLIALYAKKFHECLK